MQVEDSELEIFVVPVAVGIALQGSNLTVDQFQLSGADAVSIPATVFSIERPGWGVPQTDLLTQLLFYRP